MVLRWWYYDNGAATRVLQQGYCDNGTATMVLRRRCYNDGTSTMGIWRQGYDDRASTTVLRLRGFDDYGGWRRRDFNGRATATGLQRRGLTTTGFEDDGNSTMRLWRWGFDDGDSTTRLRRRGLDDDRAMTTGQWRQGNSNEDSTATGLLRWWEYQDSSIRTKSATRNCVLTSKWNKMRWKVKLKLIVYKHTCMVAIP